MVNLRPERTGQPFVVFISQRGGAQHDMRVRAATGPRLDSAVDVSAALWPQPRVIPPGRMTRDDFAKLMSWIELNGQAVVDYWNGDIAYTEDVLAALRKLPT